MNYSLHMSSGHIMGFEIVACDLMESGLMGFDEAGHDDAGRHIANAHKEELNERYFTPETLAESHRKKGTKWKNTLSTTMTPTAMMTGM